MFETNDGISPRNRCDYCGEVFGGDGHECAAAPGALLARVDAVESSVADLRDRCRAASAILTLAMRPPQLLEVAAHEALAVLSGELDPALYLAAVDARAAYVEGWNTGAARGRSARDEDAAEDWRGSKTKAALIEVNE